MRNSTVLACAMLLSLAGPAHAQRSLFDQTPVDPGQGFAPPAATAPAPQPALAPAPSQAPVAAPPPAAEAAPGPRAARAPSPPPEDAQAPAAPAKPRPKPKPKGPRAASAVTIVNASTATVTSIAITAGDKTVTYAKPLPPDGRAVVKLPKFKGCSITLVPAFGDGAGLSGEVDVCKDKVIRLTE